MRLCTLFLFFIFSFHYQTSAENGSAVTYEELLREMVDLAALSEYPDPPYLAARASSFEPLSPVDSVPHGLSNYDHGFYRDTLPEGYLMLDAEGPGVITHIWSARSNGDLVFYFDDDTTPSWTVSMIDFLQGTGMLSPPFSHVAGMGENCYFPIPYRKRCRIFYNGENPDIYYHIDYRTYTHNTTVPTFTSELIAENSSLIDSISVLLTDSTDTAVSPETPPDFSGSIEPDQSVPVATLDGPGVITGCTVTADERLTPAFLRSCLLEITFDSAAYPQVRLPIGDFFCAVPRRQPFRALPVHVTSDGTMICRWVMPYRSHAEVRLVNLGDRTDSCSIAITSRPNEWTDNTMYFYARWRQDPGCIIDRHLYWNIYMADPLRDHPMLHITGKGVHVGTILHVWNQENAWWGEGDDKITIDDLPEPSFLGTGTEDYFGYAWSTATPFSHAYHAQPFSDGHGGHTVNARFHVSDPQPFTTSYRFDMEIQAALRPTVIDFGRAVFFYACGNATTDHDTLTADDLFLREETTAIRPVVLSAQRRSTGTRIQYDTRRGLLLTTLTSASAKAPVIRIFRADGRLVTERQVTSRSGALPIAGFPAGIYIAMVSDRERQTRLRFVISR